MVKIIKIKKWLAKLARHADGSTDTLELDFEQVCQPTAPQVTQLWYKEVGNRLEIPLCHDLSQL